ncbi:hypothetical protein DPM19_31505 [Actinomadura craniellae]|uniref:Uncharacterized protein n=1 Tax=Actinomadura craniellae TaxID=2231787 RepID=A0A365GWS3_9ACTN|nr:hypothetical protein DPM19_31505 [Actinomadura craniellae]
MTFETRGWQQVQENAWVNPDDDACIVDHFDIPPNLPAALEDPDTLGERLAAHTAASGGGLVELEVIGLDGLAAVRQIVKLPLPDRPSGVAYIASFIAPRAGASVVLRFQCMEHGTTGVRDASVYQRFVSQRMSEGRRMEEIMSEWARHPYVPDLRGGLPRNLSDDPYWDEHFPDHPLSRARRLQLQVYRSITIDPAFKQLPPFRGPA